MDHPCRSVSCRQQQHRISSRSFGKTRNSTPAKSVVMRTLPRYVPRRGSVAVAFIVGFSSGVSLSFLQTIEMISDVVVVDRIRIGWDDPFTTVSSLVADESRGMEKKKYSGSNSRVLLMFAVKLIAT